MEIIFIKIPNPFPKKMKSLPILYGREHSLPKNLKPVYIKPTENNYTVVHPTVALPYREETIGVGDQKEAE